MTVVDAFAPPPSRRPDADLPSRTTSQDSEPTLLDDVGAGVPATPEPREQSRPRTTTTRSAEPAGTRQAGLVEPAGPGAAPTTSDSKVLVVVENGKIVYVDGEVYVVDLDALSSGVDADDVFGVLKDLKGVKASPQRTSVADRLTNTMRESLAL